MPKVIIAPSAESDLAAISDYIALDNPGAADRFLDAAKHTFENLAVMPGLGRNRFSSDTRLNWLLCFHIKGFERYLVFYEPVKDGIEIFHVLHSARNLEEF